jgi:RimJ/RimL family protein N-acetyltransferase
VILGVDAENESAIVLYERVGMHVDGRHYLMRRAVGA